MEEVITVTAPTKIVQLVYADGVVVHNGTESDIIVLLKDIKMPNVK